MMVTIFTISPTNLELHYIKQNFHHRSKATHSKYITTKLNTHFAVL